VLQYVLMMIIKKKKKKIGQQSLNLLDGDLLFLRLLMHFRCNAYSKLKVRTLLLLDNLMLQNSGKNLLSISRVYLSFSQDRFCTV
jgi:hypothetical protein